MEYMLLLYASEADWAKLTPEEEAREMAGYQAFGEALAQAGVMRGGNRLRDVETATTVKRSNGKSQVQNGPYVETKEQLGGYYVVDAPDLDAALAWAARCPCAGHGTVEVRPIWPMGE